MKSETKLRLSRSSGSLPGSFRITWPWLAIVRTDIRDQRPGCSHGRDVDQSSRSYRRLPADVLSDTNRQLALLFKDLATLRTDIPLFKRVQDLKWKGPNPSFAATAQKIDAARLQERVTKLALHAGE